MVAPGALRRPIRPDIESQSVPRYLLLSYVDLAGEVHIERLGLTRIAGEPDVLERIHKLNLFSAVCFCRFRRFLVDASQCRAFVVFGDEAKGSFCVPAIQFDADLIIRFAIGLVLQHAFKDFSVLLQSSLCLVDFPSGAACDGDEFPLLAGFRRSYQ